MLTCCQMARAERRAIAEWRAERFAGVTPEAARAAIRYARKRERGDSDPPPSSLPAELQAFLISTDDWRGLVRESRRLVVARGTMIVLPGDLLAVGRWREIGARLLASC